MSAPRPRLSWDPAPLPLEATRADPVPRKGERGGDRRGRGQLRSLDGPSAETEGLGRVITSSAVAQKRLRALNPLLVHVSLVQENLGTREVVEGGWPECCNPGV